MARLMHTLPPRYEKHMHVSIFLAFGPLTRSIPDDDAAQYIGASSLIVIRNERKGGVVRDRCCYVADGRMSVDDASLPDERMILRGVVDVCKRWRHSRFGVFWMTWWGRGVVRHSCSIC
jgi:hypothetical protein